MRDFNGSVVPLRCVFGAGAGDCGIQVDLPAPAHAADAAVGGAIAALFHEELGLVLEVAADQAQAVVQAYTKAGVAASVVGKVSGAFPPSPHPPSPSTCTQRRTTSCCSGSRSGQGRYRIGRPKAAGGGGAWRRAWWCVVVVVFPLMTIESQQSDGRMVFGRYLPSKA